MSLGRVCKGFLRLQQDRNDWPMVLDMRSRQFSMHLYRRNKIQITSNQWSHLLTRLRADKIKISTVYMSVDIKDQHLNDLRLLPIQHLYLGGCHNITDVGLGHLRSLPLQHLDIIRCRNITDVGLGHLRSLPLQHLDLSYCHKITDVGLGHLRSLPLQELHIACCKLITDVGLRHLRSLPLQKLTLNSRPAITDIQTWDWDDIRFCSMITEERYRECREAMF